MDLGQRTASVKFLISDRGGPVHRLCRRLVHRGGHQDRGQPAAGAQSERDLRKAHRHPAPGVPRPARSPQAPPAKGADRVPEAHHAARPHRCLGQLTPAQAGTRPPEPVNLAEYRVRRKQVLGGLTSEYYSAASPATVATGNAGHRPNRISEPHKTCSSGSRTASPDGRRTNPAGSGTASCPRRALAIRARTRHAAGSRGARPR